MPAKAMVSVEAFPFIHRFRGHGPLLQDRRFDCGEREGHGTVPGVGFLNTDRTDRTATD
jgi:hypothetical protein